MPDILIEPKDCALVLVDQQAGLAFGVGSIDRQMLLNNVIALARTATVFGMPIVASTSATKVYSGPLMPAIHAAIPEVVAIDRRNMNMWEDDAARDRTAEADLFGAVDGSVRDFSSALRSRGGV